MGARARRRVVHAAAAAAYLALAVGLWWGIWSGHPTTTATCGCGDTSLFTWAMAWPSWALAHGHSLLFSTRLHHPYGMNVPANTTVLALSLPLTPVTRLAGPVASLAVAATLAPVASALAARAVVLRWTTWAPAAFVAGLAYGFSPFVLESLTLEHVDMATLVVPPLLLLCLDEVLVTQRRRAGPVGLALGGLAAVQFFISPEVLVMCALAAACGLVLLVGGALVVDRAAVAARWRHAASGLGVGAGTAGVLLAYPAWYVLAGPRHLPGQLWPDQQLFGNTWQSVLWPSGPHDRGPNAILEVYGSFGPHPLLRGYLGVGFVAVLLVGLVWFRHDLRLWFFAALTVTMEVLALGATAWPWRVLGHLPVVENVVPGRLAAVADLFAAVLVGLVVDRARGALAGRGRWVAGTAALALAAAALVPVAVYDGAPLVVRDVAVPPWFPAVGAHLPASAVVLTYPFASSGLQAPMTWQATTGLRFALAGGGGITPAPPARPTAAERSDAAAARDLTALSYGFLPPPRLTPAELARLRRALTDWGVTTVVVPSEAGTPPALRARSVPLAVATFTAVLGRRPAVGHGAWTWTVRPGPGTSLVLPAGAVEACAASRRAAVDPGAAATCVLAGAGGPGTPTAPSVRFAP